MAQVLYLHPHNHPLPDVLPVGAIGALNLITQDKLGRYAHEVRAEEIEAARVVLLDLHWSFPLAVLRETVAGLRRIHPDVRVVLGGLTAAFYGRALLTQSGADFAVTGDVEVSLAALVTRLLAGEDPGGLAGVIGRDTPDVPARRLSQAAFDQLDWLTLDWFPTCERIVRERHVNAGGRTLGDNIHPILPMARGCVRSCRFCAGGFQDRVFGRRVLLRSPETLVRDLRRVEAMAGLRAVSIFLSDASFLPRYAQALAGLRFDLQAFVFFCGAAPVDAVQTLRRAFAGQVTFSLVQPQDLAALPGPPPDPARFVRMVQALADLRHTRCTVYHVHHAPDATLEALSGRNPAMRVQGAQDWDLARPLMEPGPEASWLPEQLATVQDAARALTRYRLVRALLPDLAACLPLPVDLGQLVERVGGDGAERALPEDLARLVRPLIRQIRDRGRYGFDLLDLELRTAAAGARDDWQPPRASADQDSAGPFGWAHPGPGRLGSLRWRPTLTGFAFEGSCARLERNQRVCVVPVAQVEGRPWLTAAHLARCRVPGVEVAAGPAGSVRLGGRVDGDEVTLWVEAEGTVRTGRLPRGEPGDPRSLVVAVMGHASVHEPATYNFGPGRLVAHAQQAVPTTRFALFDRRMSDDEAEDLALLQQARPDVVGLSCTLWSLGRVVRLAGRLRQVLPDTRLVIGGPSVLDFEAMAGADGPRADHTIVGEGEVAFARLVAALSAGTPPPPGRLDAPTCSDLDLLASPYLSGVLRPRGETLYLETSRGCPLKCAFCAAGGSDDPLRWFSLQRVGAELRWALEHGLHDINLCDAALNYDTDRLRALVEEVERVDPQRRLALSFALHADFLDAAQIELLGRLNIRQTSLGLNSTNPATFSGVRRRIHPERFRAAITGLARIIRPAVTIILGLPGDTPQGFAATLAYCETLPADIQIFELMVLPATAYRRDAGRFGLMFDPQRGHAVTGAHTLSASDLDEMRGMRSAFLSRHGEWRQADFSGDGALLSQGTAGALRDLLRGLGVLGGGDVTLDGWRITEVDATRHKHKLALVCLGPQDEPLVALLSARDDQRPAFARTARFDLSYASQAGQPPSPGALRWLRAFHDRLSAADP